MERQLERKTPKLTKPRVHVRCRGVTEWKYILAAGFHHSTNVLHDRVAPNQPEVTTFELDLWPSGVWLEWTNAATQVSVFENSTGPVRITRISSLKVLVIRMCAVPQLRSSLRTGTDIRFAYAGKCNDIIRFSPSCGAAAKMGFNFLTWKTYLPDIADSHILRVRAFPCHQYEQYSGWMNHFLDISIYPLYQSLLISSALFIDTHSFLRVFEKSHWTCSWPDEMLFVWNL